ncbi:hypothetical protein [uncultured Hyphomicrobium sp.]|uniref:hypothetical protein n=1 Tax=uncultured Hyphomicrobium sp. TaxID=194373 RepID=UPI0025CC6494|nr:hypothetical protein [uncultured Hyphomicrobium sp.]
MRKNVIAVAATLVAFACATSADARPSRDESWNPFVQQSSVTDQTRADRPRAKRERSASRQRGQRVSRERGQRVRYATRQREARRYAARTESYSSSSYSGGAGPRPRAWCGWWMRTQRGGGPHLNLAWNWSKWGRASGPQVGAVVVWRHHVGEIVGRAPNGQWLVRSGNDGGAVRTRARSVSGAVFRVG